MDNDRYTTYSGESSIQSVGTKFSLICCDCGLTHEHIITYDPTNQLTCISSRREKENTKKNRRYLRRRKEGVFKRWKSGAK